MYIGIVDRYKSAIVHLRCGMLLTVASN